MLGYGKTIDFGTNLYLYLVVQGVPLHNENLLLNIKIELPNPNHKKMK